MPLENLEVNARDAGRHEGDMLLTPYQELVIASGAFHARASITIGKWPNAVLPYEIEYPLSTLFDVSYDFSRVTSGLQLILLFLLFSFSRHYQSPNTELFFSYFFLQSHSLAYVKTSERKQ